MALSLFKKEIKKEFLVFDVGNGSVGGALVMEDHMGERGELKIISSCRVDINVGESVEFDRLLKNVIQSIDDVSPSLNKAYQNENIPIFVVLASPWYVSQTKILNIKNDRTFTFDKAMSDDIINKELEDFRKSVSSSESGDSSDELDVIEGQVIHTKLNGYDTSDPIGKKAKEAEISLYMSVSQRKVVSGIAEKIYSHFPHGQISFHSFPLAYFSSINSIFPEKKNFMLLDISGEITDVSLVRNSIILETVSFPMGRNFILRKVASQINRTMPETLSLISLYSKGAMDLDIKEKMNNIIAVLKNEWLIQFQKVLSDMSNGLYVPNELFIAVDDDIAPIFLGWVKGEEFSQYVLSHDKFKVIPISGLLLEPIINPEGIKYDQFLNIGVLFTHKLLWKNS